MKKVLITGILGQDGANMAEHLLSLDDDIEVCGMMRRTSNVNKSNIEAFESHPNFKLVYGDLTDEISLDKLVKEIQPDYFINFAANSGSSNSVETEKTSLSSSSIFIIFEKPSRISISLVSGVLSGARIFIRPY